jgi:hypothetical protein
MKRSPTPRAGFEGVEPLIQADLVSFELVAANVGEAQATKFVSFYKMWRELPDRAEIYANPQTARVSDKPDVLFAITSALAAEAKPNNIKQTFQYLERLPVQYAVLFQKDVASRNSKLVNTPEYLASFTDWAGRNAAALGVR